MDAVTINVSELTFGPSGGTQVISVTSDTEYALVSEYNYVSVAIVSGTPVSDVVKYPPATHSVWVGPGVSEVSVTVPSYSYYRERKAEVFFRGPDRSKDFVHVPVKQRPELSAENFYLGDDAVQGFYLGDKQVEALWLGDTPIFPAVPNTLSSDDSSKIFIEENFIKGWWWFVLGLEIVDYLVADSPTVGHNVSSDTTGVVVKDANDQLSLVTQVDMYSEDSVAYISRHLMEIPNNAWIFKLVKTTQTYDLGNGVYLEDSAGNRLSVDSNNRLVLVPSGATATVFSVRDSFEVGGVTYWDTMDTSYIVPIGTDSYATTDQNFQTLVVDPNSVPEIPRLMMYHIYGYLGTTKYKI